MQDNNTSDLKKVEDFFCEVKTKNQKEPIEEKVCVLNFKVGNSSTTEEVKLTIDQPKLHVLLDGLHKIQSQLSSVANKNKS